MISAQCIAEQRLPEAAHVVIEVVGETGSTNTDLLARVRDLHTPVFLIAEKQTQGRGRFGRAWLSAPGGSLTFSLAWKFRRTMQELSGLSLAVGVAVAQTLRAHGVRTALKWPNDIWKDGKKLGGILIEVAKAPEGTWAVMGVGLNLILSDELEGQITQPAAEARWLAQSDRNTLLAALLNGLAAAMAQFEREGFAAFADRWNDLHAHAGKKVSILHGDQVLLEGVASGVDGSGHFLLETDSGRRTINAGEISLRAMEE